MQSNHQKNLYKVKVHYWENEREFGLLTTDYINKGDIVMAIPSIFIVSSFDNFPIRKYV